MDVEDTGLEIEDAGPPEARPVTALEKVRQVSLALSDAARRTRLSSRRRASFSSGGFQARRGARLLRLFMAASFLAMVVAPTVSAVVYYFFVASDQFVSEADFTLSGTPAPNVSGDAGSAFAGLSVVSIVQDTQIITNFLHTRAAVEKLEKSIGLRSFYAKPTVDWASRLDPNRPIEKIVKYWSKMSDASIVMPAGIIQLKVRAFSPADAQKITAAVLAMCEDLINELNERMNHDALASAEQELQRTSQRLGAALGALETARNQSGLLETTNSAKSISALADTAKATLLSLQGQYDAQLKSVLPTAPQMRELATRIEVTRKQIANIESKLTSKSAVDDGDATIAMAMTKFGELDLERQVAERLYAGAAASLEAARINAENKFLYLKTFISPVAPQEAQYPRRATYSLITFAISLVGWGILCGLGAMIRNYLA